MLVYVPSTSPQNIDDQLKITLDIILHHANDVIIVFYGGTFKVGISCWSRRDFSFCFPIAPERSSKPKRQLAAHELLTARLHLLFVNNLSCVSEIPLCLSNYQILFHGTKICCGEQTSRTNWTYHCCTWKIYLRVGWIQGMEIFLSDWILVLLQTRFQIFFLNNWSACFIVWGCLSVVFLFIIRKYVNTFTSRSQSFIFVFFVSRKWAFQVYRDGRFNLKMKYIALFTEILFKLWTILGCAVSLNVSQNAQA